MWINDDTTWTLTAQRHKLSSDVMLLSSLGESQNGGGGCEEIITVLIIAGFNIRDTDRIHFLELTHVRCPIANWEIGIQVFYRSHVQRFGCDILGFMNDLNAQGIGNYFFLSPRRLWRVKVGDLERQYLSQCVF